MKNKWQKVNYHLLLGEVPVALPGYCLLFFQTTRTWHRLAGAGGTSYLEKGTAEQSLLKVEKT
jgi:hypothetical protein